MHWHEYGQKVQESNLLKVYKKVDKFMIKMYIGKRVLVKSYWRPPNLSELAHLDLEVSNCGSKFSFT